MARSIGKYENGCVCKRRGGVLHNDKGPAAVCIDGSKYWAKNGEFHREDGPAIIKADGTRVWFNNGDIHRIDGPAIEHADGKEEWFIEGRKVTYFKFLAIVFSKYGINQFYSLLDNNSEEKLFWSNPKINIDSEGTILFLIENQPHRAEGPAIIRVDGSLAWFRYGKLHREDGPAVVRANGKTEWWCYGYEATAEDIEMLRMLKSKELIS